MPNSDERIVAGLSCSQVLERLSDFVDGELEPAVKARVVEHVQGCTWCEEFGGRFSSLVTALRERAGEPIEEDVARRLHKNLERLIG